MSDWYVYMVECSDGTLYTGITTDVGRRIDEHNGDKNGARYTRARQPVRLVYQEQSESRSDAARREYEIKQYSLTDKLGLLKAVNSKIGKQ